MANKTFNNVKINVKFDQAASDVIVEGGNNHASNISGNTGNGMDLSLALGKIQNWYSNWDAVVWTGNASKVNGHTVGKDVPSSAVFTDTKVTQAIVANTDSGNYPILFSHYNTSSSTTTADTVNRNAGIYITPSTGTITATNFVGTINGHTVNADIPSDAVFTDTTYTLSGAANSTTHTYDITLTPSSGTAGTPVSVPVASTSAYGITKLSSATNSTSTALAATPSAVKAAYDLANGKSTVSYSQTVASSASGAYEIGKITINGTATTIYGKDTNTTYTFAEGTTNGSFSVTPSGGSAQPVKIHGLGNMAYETKTNYVSTSSLYDSGTTVIKQEHLPSYVDDVVEGYYDATANKFYKDSAKTEEITGESGKIYVDLTTNHSYRWSGTTWVDMTGPTLIHAVNSVTAGSNGQIVIGYTDSADTDTRTVYTHPTTAGNKHLPSGPTVATGETNADYALIANGSGAGTWAKISTAITPKIAVYQGSTASAAGVKGLVPAASSGTQATHFLRADATWSSDPVIPSDTLTLNVVAAS